MPHLEEPGCGDVIAGPVFPVWRSRAFVNGYRDPAQPVPTPCGRRARRARLRSLCFIAPAAMRTLDLHLSAEPTIEFRNSVQPFIGAPYDERVHNTHP
jgi:hypothetical protein